MAVYKWGKPVTEFFFGEDNCRDPNMVFNNTDHRYGGPVSGYNDTDYAIDPINFAPHLDTPKANTFTKLGLWQFTRDKETGDVPDPPPRIIKVTGNCGLWGLDKWNGFIDIWARAYGSNWNLSPIVDGSYQGSFHFPIPVRIDENGEPCIDLAWGVTGVRDTTNWGADPSRPRVNGAWLNIILSEWGR